MLKVSSNVWVIYIYIFFFKQRTKGVDVERICRQVITFKREAPHHMFFFYPLPLEDPYPLSLTIPLPPANQTTPARVTAASARAYRTISACLVTISKGTKYVSLIQSEPVLSYLIRRWIHALSFQPILIGSFPTYALTSFIYCLIHCLFSELLGVARRVCRKSKDQI